MNPRWLLVPLLLCGCRPGSPPAAPPAPPDVLLVVLDTVRADHLSAYGYERETTPHLDRLAAEGELYLDAWAQAPWTLPAMASILTGHPQYVHGARFGDGSLYPVRPAIPTLAERLREAGYRTTAFVNVLFCDPISGLDRGFDRYDFNTSVIEEERRDARATVDAALSWLGSLRTDESSFLMLHLFDAHLPYDPPAPYDVRFEPNAPGSLGKGFGIAEEVFAIRRGEIELTARERVSLTARYDGAIRYMDEEFGRLRAGLERLGRWDRTLVVVVGDHGEELWDHGSFEHGHSHYSEVMRVPLIVRRPGRPAGARSPGRVRQIDIVPTIIEELGLATDADLPGQALGTGVSARFAVGEGSLWAGELLSVRSDDGTLVLSHDTGERRFFAADDPEERMDLWPQRPDAAVRLERLLLALPRLEADQGREWRLDEEQIERLRSLGYVQ